MNWDKAIELLEKGEASLVVTQAVILSAHGKIWISFDGREWEETFNGIIRKEIYEQPS